MLRIVSNSDVLAAKNERRILPRGYQTNYAKDYGTTVNSESKRTRICKEYG